MSRLKQRVLATIPARHRQRAVDLKNRLIGGYRQIHYSQSGEDIVIAPLLRKKTGFYVDVGANHPKRYSNTYLLYRQGWNGIVIDPLEEGMREFKHDRPRDIRVTEGIGSTEGALTYYRFSDPAFNTFSDDAAVDARKRTWLQELPTTSVRVRPLSSVLDEHLPKGTPIDFLSVDVEGLDLAVLESNDWSKFAPRVIGVEDHAFDPNHPQESAVYRFLVERGYSLYAYTGLTLIFNGRQSAS